jgi:serine/threonine-protein kinase
MEPAGTRNKYGSYRIEALVGSDSYSKCYRAYDESLDRPAALKVLSFGLSEHSDFIHQFKKNMQALAQLNHPRIPQIYYSGTEGDEYFVALEWCESGSLANQLRKYGRLPLQQGIKVLRQCIEGLAAAWKLGIAHGNLKPNNLMISDNREIKIADFGITPERPDELDVQHVSGAISFMAPELGDRKSIDFRADMYSLGIIFHYMLLNRLPSRQSLEGLQDDSSRNLLPPDVHRIIDRMTREDPQERYAGYDELIADVNGLVVSLSSETLPAIPKAIDVLPLAAPKGTLLFDMLAELYRQTATGIMKVNWLALQKRFLIRGGEIVFFESTQQNESLESLMVQRNWLKQSEILPDGKDPEGLMCRVLLSRVCTLDQLKDAYLKLLKEALVQVFHWPVFEGEFYPSKIENEPFVSLRLSDVLLESSRTLIDLNWVRSQIPCDSLINKTPSFEQLLAPFPLTPEESFLAYRFEGEDMKLDTLGLLTGMPEEKILRMTCLLQKIGALELRPATVIRRPRPAAKPAPPPPPPVPRPDPPAAKPIVVKPPPSEPKPEKPPPTATTPNTKERKLSFEEVLTPTSAPKPEKDTVAERKKKGEQYLQKAEQEYDNGNYGKAAHLCKEALQHHQDARYYQLLGASYARHPRFQRDAEEAFHKAIALAPLDPDFHAVAAAFYSQRELWLRARTHCLKAIELSSGHKMANEIYRKVLAQVLGKGDCWCVRGESAPQV